MIKVLIVDDQELFRESLNIILDAVSDIQVTGCVSNVIDALRSIEEKRPDVVLMDMRMPNKDGVEGTRLVKDLDSDIKVIVLTTFDDDEYVYGALKYGASGYILKGSPVSELKEAIHIAYTGGALINPDIASKMIKQFSTMANKSSSIQVDEESLAQLTEKELMIIREVGHGLSNREISGTLYLSEGTVRNYISTILLKLRLRDRTQLAIFAVQSGMSE